MGGGDLVRLAAVLTGITLVIVLACSTPYWKSPEADDERVFLHDGRQFQKKQIDYLLAKFAEEGMCAEAKLFHDVQPVGKSFV